MISLNQPMSISPYGSEEIQSYEGFFIPSFGGEYLLSAYAEDHGLCPWGSILLMTFDLGISSITGLTCIRVLFQQLLNYFPCKGLEVEEGIAEVISSLKSSCLQFLMRAIK
jgi:hypothetical protein